VWWWYFARTITALSDRFAAVPMVPVLVVVVVIVVVVVVVVVVVRW